MTNNNFFSYVGFGAKDMVFAPPVGFNLTFACPTGQVFESDWLAMPFVMTTCQVSLSTPNFLVQHGRKAQFDWGVDLHPQFIYLTSYTVGIYTK